MLVSLQDDKHRIEAGFERFQRNMEAGKEYSFEVLEYFLGLF